MITDELHGKRTKLLLPNEDTNLINFDNYFASKSFNIIKSLPLSITYTTIPTQSFSSFDLPSITIIEILLSQSKTNCALDLIPTSLLHNLSSHLA